MATQSEVIREAYLHLGVVDQEDNPTAAESARGQAHLDSLYDELSDTDELALPFTLGDTATSIPDWAFIGLAIALAGSLATGAGVPEMAGEKIRGRAMIRKHVYGLSMVDGMPVRAEYF